MTCDNWQIRILLTVDDRQRCPYGSRYRPAINPDNDNLDRQMDGVSNHVRCRPWDGNPNSERLSLEDLNV